VQGVYTFADVKPFTPWAALNVGYERAAVSLSGGASGDTSASGYEIGLTVGGDYKVAPQFAVGPFLGFSAGQYTSVSASGDFGGAPSIDKKLHEWFQVGVRGTFDL
jgi:hypothetical protein